MLCVTYSDVMKDEGPPASVVRICMGLLCIKGNDKQMRRVRILCKNSSDTMSLIEGTADGIIGCNSSHTAAHPTEKSASSSIVSSPDVGWGPVILWSMSNRLRLIIGCEKVDPNIEAQTLVALVASRGC